jgi:phosphatidylglycerol:prolipoprotein diacylglycerol transferase
MSEKNVRVFGYENALRPHVESVEIPTHPAIIPGTVPLADSIHNLSPFLVRFSENWGIRWYGLSYVLAFVAGFYLLRFLIRRGYSEMAEEKLTDFITYCAIFGVTLGGRLGYMLLYSPREFFANPLIFFNFLDGGMASHGGIAGLALFTLYFAKRNGYHWRQIGDNLCVVAPTGIAIVRCANFINGELWGNITTKAATPWAMKFPSEIKDIDFPVAKTELLLGEAQRIDPSFDNTTVIIEAARDNEPLREVLGQYLNYRHPSQIYQALLEGLALFLILFAIRLKWRRLPYGILTALFFIGYASFRIIGEQYRHPDAGNFPGTDLSKGQFYSLFMYGIGAIFIAYAIYERKFRSPHNASRLDAKGPP